MKHTQGKVEITRLAGTELNCRIKNSEKQTICDCYSFSEGMKDEEAEANAELIAEAFNVTNESGLTPRQLLEQRNRLLNALEIASLYVSSLSDKSDWNIIQQAISNAQNK